MGGQEWFWGEPRPAREGDLHGGEVRGRRVMAWPARQFELTHYAAVHCTDAAVSGRVLAVGRPLQRLWEEGARIIPPLQLGNGGGKRTGKTSPSYLLCEYMNDTNGNQMKGKINS